MKVKVYHVINCEGEILKRIITPDVPKKDADFIAFKKLKSRLPDHYYFVKLKYIGKEEMMSK